jgi:hypothetical protein
MKVSESFSIAIVPTYNSTYILLRIWPQTAAAIGQVSVWKPRFHVDCRSRAHANRIRVLDAAYFDVAVFFPAIAAVPTSVHTCVHAADAETVSAMASWSQQQGT